MKLINFILLCIMVGTFVFVTSVRNTTGQTITHSFMKPQTQLLTGLRNFNEKETIKDEYFGETKGLSTVTLGIEGGETVLPDEFIAKVVDIASSTYVVVSQNRLAEYKAQPKIEIVEKVKIVEKKIPMTTPARKEPVSLKRRSISETHQKKNYQAIEVQDHITLYEVMEAVKKSQAKMIYDFMEKKDGIVYHIKSLTPYREYNIIAFDIHNMGTDYVFFEDITIVDEKKNPIPIEKLLCKKVIANNASARGYIVVSNTYKGAHALLFKETKDSGGKTCYAKVSL